MVVAIVAVDAIMNDTPPGLKSQVEVSEALCHTLGVSIQ
jgi:hypothetical protein